MEDNPEQGDRQGSLALFIHTGDPKHSLSREDQVLIDSNFSTVICAPICSSFDGFSTQVLAGVAEGLKEDSSIHCDQMVSIPKSALTDFIGRLDQAKALELDLALEVALGLK